MAPPPDLADAPLVALVLPFGEKVSPLHDHAGREYQWGGLEAHPL